METLEQSAPPPAAAGETSREIQVGRTCLRLRSGVPWLSRRLRDHQAGTPNPGPARTLDLVFYGAGDKPAVFENRSVVLGEYHRVVRDRNCIHCQLYDPGEITQAQWYYRHLLPLLVAVVPLRGDALLHAACIVDEKIGPVLLLGERGAGKSTLSAMVAEAGGVVLSDDLVCLSRAGAGGTCIANQAPEMHLSRDVAGALSFIRGTEVRADYLPGAGRIAIQPQEVPNLVARAFTPDPLNIFVLAPTHRRAFDAEALTRPVDKAKLWWRSWPHNLALANAAERARLADFVEDLIASARFWLVRGTPSFDCPDAADTILSGIRRCVSGGP